MTCTQCGTQNESGRKFCMECGARLASGCPNCGAQNPETAKFCGECGTTLGASQSGEAPGQVTAAPSVPGTAAAERRLVTVLFADLVGFTALSESLDAEDTRDFLTRYFDLTRTIIERYGGTVEKFIGDAVMAVWGAPTAHEDDAERAVRAALDICRGVPGVGGKFDVQVRAGLLTGEAAVTVGATGQGMVAGDLVNTASRLQSVAPPGSVLVGEATYRAANGAVSFEEAGEHLLKGKQAPVPSWRATAVVGLRRGTGRSGALEPPFTGRDEELRLLKELFHATQREGKARMAAVVGEGGLGKSRLAWEFEKYIDGVVDTVYWHYGRSPAYGDGISYWALAEMVRGRAGIAENDEPALARSRLRDAADEWLTDEQERHWVEPRLAALLALEPMPPGSRDELFAAWQTFFGRIAERNPTVMVFEDLQWADDGMLDFIVDLLDRSRNQPLFVIALARPELNERRPGWNAGLRTLSQMSLEPLAPDQMAEMVRGTVPGLGDEAVNAIVARAEGIPLYAVETIRMLIDRGDLVAAGDSYEMRSSLEQMAVPETLHALIAARLDALGESDRRLIQAAAIVGQSFTSEALAAVAGVPDESVRDRLAAMVVRQLLTVDADPRSPERGQYQFVQSVVKEIAAGSLSRADRRALHLSAARHFESLGDEELAGVLASHYVEAFRQTPPGPEADALAAQARVSLRGAAERAISLHSYNQALAYLEQVLAVTTDRHEMVAVHERAAMTATRHGLFDMAMGHARAVEAISRDAGDRLGALRGVILQAGAHLAEHSEKPAIALLTPALEAVADLGSTPEVIDAQAELARALMIGGLSDESIAWSDRVLSAPSPISDEQLIDVLITRGSALINSSRVLEGEILLRGAMHVAEQQGLVSAALRARNNLLGVVEYDDQAAARDLLADGYALAERYGMRTRSLQFAHSCLSNAFERGDWDAWLEETATFDAVGFYGAWRLVELSMRDAFRGRLDEAFAELSQGRELAGTTSTQAVTAIAGVESALHFAAGEFGAVMTPATVGWSLSESAPRSILMAMAAGVAANEPPWVSQARVAFKTIDHKGKLFDGQRAALESCLGMLEGRWSEARAHYIAARRDLGAAHAAFWAAILDLSLGMRAAGQFPEAGEAMAAAEEFFSRVGALPFLERYRAAFVRDEVAARAPTGAVSSLEGTVARLADAERR